MNELSSQDVSIPADISDRIADGERFVIVHNGQRVAAIISPGDLELLEELEDVIDLEAAREAEKDIEKEGTVSLESVIQKYGL